MTRSLVSLDVEGPVARLTLDRPDHDNRITAEMMQTLHARLGEVRGRADVLVLQGRGEHFTLGRDQNDRTSTLSRDQSLALAMDVNQALMEFEGLVVAAVRGRALGFGSGLVVQSDLVIAGDDATFGFDELAHGFPPMIVMSYLGRYVLPKHALELIVTSRKLTAAEAVDIGIVNRVVPSDELEGAVEELLSQLLSLNLAAAKRAKGYLRDIEHVEPQDRAAYALRSQIDWFDHGR